MAEHREKDRFGETVGRRERRSRIARKARRTPAWFGFGMFGLVGWSVMVPAIIGVVIGLWLDERLADGILWTLMMTLIGILLGCVNAWYWVSQERNRIERDRREKYRE